MRKRKGGPYQNHVEVNKRVLKAFAHLFDREPLDTRRGRSGRRATLNTLSLGGILPSLEIEKQESVREGEVPKYVEVARGGVWRLEISGGGGLG